MSFQEKRMIASIVTTFVVFGTYFLVIFGMYRDGRFAGGDAFSLLGQSILVLIVGGIVLNIVLTILFSIVLSIANRESNPSFVVDERDRQIELRASNISHYVFGAGFILSMIAMATGQTAFLVFNLIVASFGVASLVECVTQITLYRRGI